LDSVEGSGAQVTLTGAQAAIVGGGDVISASNSALTLYDANGPSDVVSGAGDTVTLTNASASLTGAHDAFYFSGSAALSLTGTAEAFYFGASLGEATISGFAASDQLHLSAKDWSSFAALQSSHDLVQSGADTVIRLDAADSITLKGVQASTLTAAQFAFA
jgi:hypothetical protein